MKSIKTNSQTLQEGAFLLLTTAIITKIIGALFKIPLSSDNCLGDLGFGYFSASYDLLTPVTTLAVSGFPVAVSHLISQYASKKAYAQVGQVIRFSKRFLIIFGLCALILFALLIYPFVKFTDETGNTLYGLIAILPSILFCSIVSLYRGYFEGFLNMRPAAVSNLIEAFCKLILGFSFAFVTVKLTGNIALGAAAALFGITLGIIFATVYIYIKFKKHSSDFDFSAPVSSDYNSQKLSKLIIVLSLTVAISSLSTSIVSFIDALTVRNIIADSINSNIDFFTEKFNGLLQNNTLSELPTVLYGIKSKAFTLFNILISLTMALGVSTVPNISNKEIGDKQVLKNINISLKLTSLIASPVTFGFIFLGENIMSLIFGVGLSATVGGKILIIYGFASFFAAFSIILANILQSFKCQNFVLTNILIATVIKIILNIFLTHSLKFNIYGNAIATLIFYFIIFLLSLTVFCKKININSLNGVFLKPLISGLFSGISAYLVVQISSSKIFTILAVLVAAVVYFALILITRFLNKEDFLNFGFNRK